MKVLLKSRLKNKIKTLFFSKNVIFVLKRSNVVLTAFFQYSVCNTIQIPLIEKTGT